MEETHLPTFDLVKVVRQPRRVSRALRARDKCKSLFGLLLIDFPSGDPHTSTLYKAYSGSKTGTETFKFTNVNENL